MKQLLKKLFGPFFTRLASNASAPDRKQVYASLSSLLKNIKDKPGKKGIVLEYDLTKDKFIIFSDHHKGNRDAGDDFANNEPNYLEAMKYYFENKFAYINLGDSEELWKYAPPQVIPKNGDALKAESKFHDIKKYYKTFGNHDLTWKNKLDVDIWFKNIFTLPLPVWEGILLKTTIGEKPLSIFLTHGHQGDKMSDNNAFSTWMVSHIWRPIQRYLALNVNTPAKDFVMRDRHNIMMHEWSSRRADLLLVTGHTHKPVFASGKYSDKENKKIDNSISKEKKVDVKPCYFNSGCCCYNDGDITGIEIADGKISLIKWHWDNNTSKRSVLEEKELVELVKDL